jgi:hypothetical protein
MSTQPALNEPLVVRQAFPHWSVRVPEHFDETFDYEASSWHVWDASRSVSLSSQVITERGRPVSAKRLVRQLRLPVPGTPVPPPPDLLGWAVVVPTSPPARAARAISGILAVKGRILVATVTADDLVWATAVWRSIRYSAVPIKGPLVITLPAR